MGELDVASLDEFGVSMTLPTCYGWFPVRERLLVPYEAAQGRRVNGIGLLFTHGPDACDFQFELRAKIPQDRSKTRRRSLEERATEHGVRPEEVGSLHAASALAFIWKAAGRPLDAPAHWRRERPLYIYLDNYSVHTSQEMKAARRDLEDANIHLKFLPSYTPEMSDIEPVWNDVKYHRMSRRSFQVLGDLMKALAETLRDKAHDLLASHKTRKLCAQAT